MKRTFSIALFIPVLIFTACHRNQASIEGMIKGGAGSTLRLEMLEGGHTRFIDSVAVGKHGRYSLSTRLEQPELYILRTGDDKIINLLLAPGEKVTVNTNYGDFDVDYSVEGSPESEDIRTLVMQMRSTRAILDSLKTVANGIQDLDSPQMDLVKTAYARTMIEQKRYTIRYLVQHIHSLSSIYALYQKYDENMPVMGDDEEDLQYFRTLADSLDASFSNSSLTRSLKADIVRREEAYKQEKQLNSLLEMAGSPTGSPDLTIPDLEGREISLSSLEGKVILLIFWASDQEESVHALLGLRSIYQKYHSRGFEIYAVSLDSSREKWMNAVSFNEFDWINVSELSFPESQAMKTFNISSLPTNFLIDRKGDLVAKNIYGRTLETWLDNLLVAR